MQAFIIMDIIISIILYIISFITADPDISFFARIGYSALIGTIVSIIVYFDLSTGYEDWYCKKCGSHVKGSNRCRSCDNTLKKNKEL